jgi:hypothetical protein
VSSIEPPNSDSSVDPTTDHGSSELICRARRDGKGIELPFLCYEVTDGLLFLSISKLLRDNIQGISEWSFFPGHFLSSSIREFGHGYPAAVAAGRPI